MMSAVNPVSPTVFAVCGCGLIQEGRPEDQLALVCVGCGRGLTWRQSPPDIAKAVGQLGETQKDLLRHRNDIARAKTILAEALGRAVDDDDVDVLAADVVLKLKRALNMTSHGVSPVTVALDSLRAETAEFKALTKQLQAADARLSEMNRCNLNFFGCRRDPPENCRQCETFYEVAKGVRKAENAIVELARKGRA